MPDPSGDQLRPSHFATRSTLTPPARVNDPATWSDSGFGPGPSSSNAASANTVPFRPEPTLVQLVPSQRAIPPAGLPSAVVNSPPANRQRGIGPGPSSSK